MRMNWNSVFEQVTFWVYVNAFDDWAPSQHQTDLFQAHLEDRFGQGVGDLEITSDYNGWMLKTEISTSCEFDGEVFVALAAIDKVNNEEGPMGFPVLQDMIGCESFEMSVYDHADDDHTSIIGDLLRLPEQRVCGLVYNIDAQCHDAIGRDMEEGMLEHFESLYGWKPAITQTDGSTDRLDAISGLGEDERGFVYDFLTQVPDAFRNGAALNGITIPDANDAGFQQVVKWLKTGAITKKMNS